MDLFPAFVSYECVRFAPGDEDRFAVISLPRELSRAVAKRKLEFLAGRYCARRALGGLVPGLLQEPVPVGADRAPVWPAGIVGAITHAEGFAAAAVARSTDARGVGLDVERIVALHEMEAVATQAATRDELAALGAAGLGDALLLTLVFSAKESLFKCLYPLVGRYFDFLDATVVEVNREEQSFTIELRCPLGGLEAGRRLSGRFAITDGLVHTGITAAASTR